MLKQAYSDVDTSKLKGFTFTETVSKSESKDSQVKNGFPDPFASLGQLKK